MGTHRGSSTNSFSFLAEISAARGIIPAATAGEAWWGGSRCPTCRCSGRRPSALGRRSTSRGRAALQMIGTPPRGPGSGTIDHHLRPSPLNGKAFDRPPPEGCRRCREGRRRGAVGDCLGNREQSHWRYSCHHECWISANVEGVVVGDEVVVENSASRTSDLVEGLEVKFELSGRLAVEQAVEADDRPRTAARSLTARRWADERLTF